MKLSAGTMSVNPYRDDISPHNYPATEAIIRRRSSKMGKMTSRTLNGRPGMFGDWRKVAKVLGGWVFVGLLFWAAIYELVFW